jgi:DNA-directed RNA polymerase subunit RPC12/RpoP
MCSSGAFLNLGHFQSAYENVKSLGSERTGSRLCRHCGGRLLYRGNPTDEPDPEKQVYIPASSAMEAGMSYMIW